MNYYDDDGTELEYISGNEYINVAVYLSAGTYTPFITAKATNNDIILILKAAGLYKSVTPPALTLTASTLSMSIPLSSDSTVTLTPANAVGAVTYTANQSWGTFSGNVVTLRPTATGTYSVIITARDSLGRTAAVTLRVTVISSTPASGDIKPDSGDIRPVSPDIKPSSQDKPVPAESEDITPGGNDPASVMPEVPRVNIKDAAMIQKILNILSSPLCCCISGDTEIAELPEEFVGGEISLEDVSEEDLASIPEDEIPAAILPIIRVNRPAVYVFGVGLSNMDSGAYIFLHVMPEAATAQADECSDYHNKLR